MLFRSGRRRACTLRGKGEGWAEKGGPARTSSISATLRTRIRTTPDCGGRTRQWAGQGLSAGADRPRLDAHLNANIEYEKMVIEKEKETGLLRVHSYKRVRYTQTQECVLYMLAAFKQAAGIVDRNASEIKSVTLARNEKN
ncbi:hypothetical protein MRX96_043237 [Rhipicephalus microplus]